jgi:hypothetical protein
MTMKSIRTAGAQVPRTNVWLALDRPQALIAWACERDAAIREDDYDVRVPLRREAIGAPE